MSECDISEQNDKLVLLVHNSMARGMNYPIRLPVRIDRDVKVTDSEGRDVPLDLIPISNAVIDIPERSSQARDEAVFVAQNVPPMGKISSIQ